MKAIRIIIKKFQPMQSIWKELRRNWIVAWAHRSVFACFIISILAMVWRWRLLPPAVPLWYSRPWGEDQLAHPLWLFVLPVGGLVWHGINVWVSTAALDDYPIFVRVMALASFLVNLLSMVTLINILLLVT